MKTRRVIPPLLRAGFLPSVLIAVLLLSAACVTPPAQQEDAVIEMLKLIDEGRQEELVEHSMTPFLLDAEIIEAESDIAALWGLLAERGFDFPSPRIVRIIELEPGVDDLPEDEFDDDTYQLFGDSMEVRAFFMRHIPEDAALTEVEAGGKLYRFLFAGNRDGKPMMFGWKGPIEEKQSDSRADQADEEDTE